MPTSPATILPQVIGLVLLLGLALFVGTIFNLWVQALLSGARVGFLELAGMRLRRVDPRPIVLSRIRAVKAGLEVSTAQLEAHHLAGGRVANCVTAMIAAAKAGRAVPWHEVAEADLAGIDILTLTAEALGLPVASPVERGPREERYVRAVQAAPPAAQPAAPTRR